MNFLLKSITYLLHPILMPLLGSIIYLSISPRFIPVNIIESKIFGLTIVTVLIPIVLFFFLKTTRIISSIHLEKVKQRKIPLMLHSFLLLLVIKTMIDINNFPELYFFILGILFSTLSALFMVFFSIKISLHMLGTGSVTMFIITLSIHFGINLTLLIAILIIVNGLLATSRLHHKAHTYLELLLGLLIGIIPQLTLINFWL